METVLHNTIRESLKVRERFSLMHIWPYSDENYLKFNIWSVLYCVVSAKARPSWSDGVKENRAVLVTTEK